MRNILPLASAVVLGVVLAASSRGALAEDAPGIVVYNAQHASLTQAWADGFTRDTGIKVTLRKGSDMEFANQIVQEGAASPADVFVTENSPAMALVDSAGLFTPLPKDILDRVPEGFRPSDGHWVGVAARSTVFVYDTRKLDDDDLPASMLDLAQPAWQGRWAASPSGADFQAIVGALVELKGPEVATSWLKAMKTNAKPYKGNSTAMKAVNAGEVQGAGDVLVRVVRLDEGDAGVLLRQSGRRKRAGNAMGGEAPGDERHVPDRAEGAGGSVACLRQKAAIEGRSAPVPAHFHMR